MHEFDLERRNSINPRIEKEASVQTLEHINSCENGTLPYVPGPNNELISIGSMKPFSDNLC
jgi:hypothetical protein